MSFAAAGRLTDLIGGTSEMNAVWSARQTVQSMLDVEAALARATAAHGVIPAVAVAAIVAACDADRIDAEALMAGAATGGNLAIPLVKQLTAAVKRDDADAAKYVHWGATSQDIIDTGAALQLRATFELLDAGLLRLCAALALQAQRYRITPMIGPTWLQQSLADHARLEVRTMAGCDAAASRAVGERTHARCWALQFGGAAGTLASLRDQALPIAQSLANDLGPAAAAHAVAYAARSRRRSRRLFRHADGDARQDCA